MKEVWKAAVKSVNAARPNNAEIKPEEKRFKSSLCSRDDTIRLEHGGTVVSEQKGKTAKNWVEKIGNSKDILPLKGFLSLGKKFYFDYLSQWV